MKNITSDYLIFSFSRFYFYHIKIIRGANREDEEKLLTVKIYYFQADDCLSGPHCAFPLFVRESLYEAFKQ